MTTTLLDEAKNTAMSAEPAIREEDQKYLTFKLGSEEYGLEILKVREIIGIMEIMQVPQTPDFVEGVINLRGKVIPVIDLRSKFGLQRTEYNVQEVHDIPAGDIEPPPKLGGAMDTAFILGMGKVKDDVKVLLDIDRVLTSEELVVPREAPGD